MTPNQVEKAKEWIYNKVQSVKCGLESPYQCVNNKSAKQEYNALTTALSIIEEWEKMKAEDTQLTLYCQGLKDKIAALEDK